MTTNDINANGLVRQLRVLASLIGVVVVGTGGTTIWSVKDDTSLLRENVAGLTVAVSGLKDVVSEVRLNGKEANTALYGEINDMRDRVRVLELELAKQERGG